MRSVGMMLMLAMLFMADVGPFREEAELVLLGGRVWTGDPRQPQAEAVAIGEGRILAIGRTESVRALIGPRTQVLNVPGRLVLPGFIDNHTHFLHGGFHLLSVDLRDARDPQEFARRIAERAKALPPGRWLTGGNWDHELWPGAPLPRKEWIDPYTPNTPVLVTRLDGHMGLANSLALRLAGITRETPDPPGGTLVRDPQTGEPTGILKDAAMALVNRVIPEPSDHEYDEALHAALREAARVGVTSIQDITEWDHWPVYRRARQQGALTVRVYARTPIPEWERQRELVAREGPGDEWLRLGGFKGFVDGSLGSTTALFFEPYADAPQTSGLLHSQMLPEGVMKQRIGAADRAGFQCSIHAIGDKANALLLEIFEEVIRENGPRDRRFRIEHAQHLRPQDIPRMARLGVIASVQPYHAIDDGRWAEKRIGRERCKTTYAFRSLLDAGVRVTFGSDWPVAPLNPLLGIYAAVTRKTLDGKNPNGWFPEQKITVEEAVRAYTVWGAYAEFAEAVKGSLEVGKLADLIVLSRDIFAIPPDEIAQVEVLYTIVGGKIVYAAR